MGNINNIWIKTSKRGERRRREREREGMVMHSVLVTMCVQMYTWKTVIFNGNGRKRAEEKTDL